ncbi:amylo-alpha-1,6-glucosidase [Nanoarchaeota archaeon]
MKIKHDFGELVSEKEVRGGNFILTNRIGGFYYSSLKTKYGGWHIFEGEMFKILEGFPGKSEYLENNFYQVNRKGSVLEEFFFPFGENSLVYGSSKAVEFVLDVRKAYDGRVWGRKYEVSVEDGKMVIKFVKRTDKREDGSNGEREFEMFVVVNGVGSIVGEWDEKEYELDKNRKSLSKRSVYRAIKFKPGRYVISAGLDKERVLARNKYVVENWEELRKKQREYFGTFLNEGLVEFCLATGLDSLVNSLDSGSLFAGLPWFFQEWGRDAAIASGALISEGEIDLAKKILFNLLEKVSDDGLLLANDESKLASADALGWVFLRFMGLLDKLKDDELKLVKSKLVWVIERLLTYHTKDKLAYNGKLETWMDTTDRTGACIEIQALRLAMYKFAFELTRDRKYKVLEEEMRKEVREKFWDGEILVDRLGSLEARPNIFIAAYVYPELLSNQEWSDAFEHVLERIWLDWGLATIDVKSSKFVSSYSGEDNKSYHNGDSWFWVNNLAALVMHRVNRDKFKSYIHKILEASKNELLWGGCIGGCAELSSANSLRSEGCVLQAWSMAMLMELLLELKT